MKRAWMMIVVLAAMLSSSFIGEAAVVVPRMRANISFSFFANDRQLPAGEYWIEMIGTGGGWSTGSTLVLRSVDGSVFHTLFANACNYSNGDQTAYLLFNRVGGTYFLSKARHGNIESSLLRSRSEKVMTLAYARDWYGDFSEVVKIAAR